MHKEAVKYVDGGIEWKKKREKNKNEIQNAYML